MIGWSLAAVKAVLVRKRTCGMEPPESASMKRPRAAMAALAEARMCYLVGRESAWAGLQG